MFKKKGVGERSKNKKTELNEWDTLAESLKFTEKKTPQELNAERQRRKIEAYFLSGEDKDFINAHDVDMLPEYENDFLQRMQDGKITRDKKERLLQSLNTPLHGKNGCEKVFDKILNDRNQIDILSMITGEDISSSNNFKPSNLLGVLQNFKTPSDFKDTETDILRYVKKRLPKDDFIAFNNSMVNFKHNFYGKREEYYEQLKVLEKMANKQSTKQTKTKKEKDVKHDEKKHRTPNNLRQRAGERNETLKNNHGVMLISRGELIGEDKKTSEDSYFANAKKGIYAVFDGVGGTIGGSAASQRASDILKELCEHEKVDLEYAMQFIHRSINDARKSGEKIGQTTAAMVQIENSPNGKILNIASVGDSRIYLMRDKQLYQLTNDDSITEKMIPHIKDPKKRKQLLEHGISKSLGDGSSISNKICSEGNCEGYQLEKGDRIMLCSDGITGDTEKNYMHSAEIQQILEKNLDDQSAAQALVQSAKKIDDRTAIVITV